MAPQFPIVLAANESQALSFFFPQLVNRLDDLTDESADAFARRAARLWEIELVVDRWYIRSSGLPFGARLPPAFLRRGRRTETWIESFPFPSTGTNAPSGRLE